MGHYNLKKGRKGWGATPVKGSTTIKSKEIAATVARKNGIPVKRVGRQRPHTTIGGVDHYPEIDRYIKECELQANIDVPERNRFAIKWDRAFLGHMNRTLEAKGLRVL